MTFVCDASAFGTLWLPDEDDRVAALLRERLSQDLLAPRHFPIELLNLLLKAQRRERIDIRIRDRLIDLANRVVGQISIVPDAPLAAVAAVADRHGLTSYDASYLELAARRGAALITADARLARAAASLELLVE